MHPLMRITQFKGRQVINTATAHRIGVIADTLIDARTARIVALEVASPEHGDCTRIPSEWITHVGNAAVMIMRSTGSTSGDSGHATERCLNYASLLGLEVLDEDGERIGTVEDAVVDAERLAISMFEVARTGWHRRLNVMSQVRPGDVASCSRDVMLIREGCLAARSSRAPSLDGRLRA